MIELSGTTDNCLPGVPLTDNGHISPTTHSPNICNNFYAFISF